MSGKRFFCIMLTLLLIAALLPGTLTAGAATAYAADRSNGSFVVELWDGSAYHQIASLSSDEFQKELKTDIGRTADPQIRIRKAADGLAFLDSVSLDGVAASGKKLQSADFDVQEITADGVVLRFTGRFDGDLSLTGRIEPKVINAKPFMFPFNNTYVEDPQDFETFLTYTLDSNPAAVRVDGKYEDLGEAFESRYLVSATGHPPGDAYIYVSNDAEYLYASADFTGDNTYDYGDDFFKVFAKVNGTVKEFKQTSSGREFGKAAMQYTGKVAYEHMYYEMKIPLSQLGNADKLQLAFSLYGTFGSTDAISNPASLVFTAGETASGILRVAHYPFLGGPISSINNTSPGLMVQFQTPASPVVGADNYADFPYTVQCTTPGNYTITVNSVQVGAWTCPVNPALTIPVQVNAIVPVTIISHPASLTVAPGQDAAFSVAVSGAAPYTYQWQKSADNGATWADISGSITDTLALAAVPYADNGTQYRCVADNAALIPATSNAATLTVTPPPITGLPSTGSLYTRGRITWDPQPAGGTWTFDSAYLSRDGNTFTALKAGTSVVAYTVNGISSSITVTARQSSLPSTGQDFIWVFILSGIAVCAAAIAIFSSSRSRKKAEK